MATKKPHNTSSRNPAMTVAAIEEKIGAMRGCITPVAQYFGVSRQTIYKRIQKSERLQNALLEAREVTLDYAESKLLKHIDQDSWPALKFYLMTQARGRGYIVSLPGAANHASLDTLKRLLSAFEVKANLDEIVEKLMEIDGK